MIVFWNVKLFLHPVRHPLVLKGRLALDSAFINTSSQSASTCQTSNPFISEAKKHSWPNATKTSQQVTAKISTSWCFRLSDFGIAFASGGAKASKSTQKLSWKVENPSSAKPQSLSLFSFAALSTQSGTPLPPLPLCAAACKLGHDKSFLAPKCLRGRHRRLCWSLFAASGTFISSSRRKKDLRPVLSLLSNLFQLSRQLLLQHSSYWICQANPQHFWLQLFCWLDAVHSTIS